MSFRLFVYYCAVCGGWAALAGWAMGRLLAPSEEGVGQDVVQGTSLGVLVALALGAVDARWDGPGRGLVAARAARVGLAGGLGAAAGSFLGGLLVRWTNLGLCVILGWGLTGLLVGASVGVFDFAARLRAGDRSGGGTRKLVHGLLGGACGGLLGGALFVGLGAALGRLLAHKPPEELLSSSAAGFVALGACIGLFAGLARVVLREAWLRVESGRRAGREMILSRDETTIGRAEGCDLGLFGDNGVERLHARVVRCDGRYLLCDAGTAGGTFLNGRAVGGLTLLRSGDAFRVGDSLVRFGERRRRGG